MTHALKPALAAALLLAAAGCGPLPAYYRAGAEVSRLETDTLACQTGALREAPVANEIRQRPPIYYPGYRHCHGGNCYYRPGYWVDGGFYTVDVNQGLRQRLERACMAAKGYQQISLKRCPRSAAPRQIPARLPPLTENACVIEDRDGRTRIIPAP
ncbi:hypothetical protein ACUXV3_04280 [Roseobacteraceae bacterium NS-SX3]